MASPVAIANPSRPSQSPASAMAIHSPVVNAGHGDTMASTGAKKKPVPMYHYEPARSDFSTNRSHRGISWSATAGWRVCIVSSSVGPETRDTASFPSRG